MLRVIKEVKPRWIIGENVQNLINISNGTILREIIEGLETEGFEVQCFSISASSQGAWHKRERVWIIATNTESKWSRERREFNKKEGLEKSKSTQLDSICSNVSDSDSRMRRRRGTIGESRKNEIWGFYSEKEEQSKQNFRSKTIRCDAIPGETKNLQHTNDQRLQEFNFSEKSNKQNFNNREFIKREKNKSWWETESRICRVPDGVSYELDKDRANRIKALGNSIVPQIARELGLAILDAEQN
jgi:DNA (cytosine-5)-methyltransferase 1